MLAKAGGGTLSTSMAAIVAASITVEVQASATSATLKVSDASGNFATTTQSVVLGTTDNDTALDGTARADFIYGFGGTDVLTGGDGADKFVYTAIADSAASVAANKTRTFDAITDFWADNIGDDRIDLSAINTILTGGGEATGVTVTTYTMTDFDDVDTFADLVSFLPVLTASAEGAAGSTTGLQAYAIDLTGNTGALGTGKYLLVNNNNTDMDAGDLMIQLTGTSTAAGIDGHFILA